MKVTNNDNKYEDYLDKEDYKLMNLTKIFKTAGIVTNASTLVVVVGMSLPSIVAYNISSGHHTHSSRNFEYGGLRICHCIIAL